MTQETLEKIKKLHLWGMARTYETSLENDKLSGLSADELVNMLIEAEWDDRQNRNIERRLRNARFRYQSSVESIDYQAERNLDRGQILRFAECNFVRKHENIIITGSTGIGKSYIATALGHQACTLGFKVYYANLGKLFSRLKMGKADGSYLKEISKIERQDLLIIDDFGLLPIDSQNRSALMEIVEDRHKRASMIITSQLPVNCWYEVIGEKTVADAILDRIVHDAHRIELRGESLRKTRDNQKKMEILN
ncbi:MAG TPA: IS21-like element helper ATPase IstB [Bacteroidales bacterium]|jgi:DNA replication protein DnaC|nr:IS21-like element helper ATPase IstB [Bacteroidales bacterium]HQK69297.1 IS21-like element helper ATPase IstB [Bacteroidales bacterium]